MSAIQKKSSKNITGDKKHEGKSSPATNYSGFIKAGENFTNVVPMDKTRGTHNKLLTRKRKKIAPPSQGITPSTRVHS